MEVKIDLVPDFRRLVVRPFGVAVGMAKFSRHDFRGAAQQTKLKLIAAPGAENQLVQKFMHPHIVNHGPGLETMGVDAARRDHHLGVRQVLRQGIQEACDDLRHAVPLGGRKPDHAPRHVVAAGAPLFKRVVERNAQHGRPCLNFRRKTVIDGLALCSQGRQTCRRALSPAN